MEDLLSFLNKKKLTLPTGEAKDQNKGPLVVVLMDNLNSQDVVKLARNATAEALYLALAKDVGHPDFSKDLKFAIRAAGEFEETPLLAFFIVKNKGIIPIRRTFVTECGPDLTARTPADLFEQLRQQAERRKYEFKMVSEDSYDLMRCAESFIDRNYNTCIRYGISALETAPNTLVALVTLISLQRLNHSDKVEELTKQLAPALTADPWLAILFQLTLGTVELPQVLATADNNERLYQALFYAGARFNTLGQIELARACFSKCAAVESSCVEKCFIDSEVYEPPSR